jgi:hypothetical protein
MKDIRDICYLYQINLFQKISEVGLEKNVILSETVIKE